MHRAVFPDRDDTTTVIARPGGKRHVTPQAAQLVCVLGPGAGRRYRVDGSVIIGRSEDTDIRLVDEGISRQHAMITPLPDGGYQISDLQSRNGTFVNGAPTRRSQLRFGDRITLGSTTVLEMTRRDTLEDQHLEAQKLQMLGQLAGGIAHDFNNLLSAMLASLGVLQGSAQERDPTETACLEDLDMATRRAVDLVGQLVAFSRAAPRERGPLKIENLLRDAGRLIQRIVHPRTEVVIDAEPEATVRADSAQLLQVVMNLCVNGSQAMPNGGRLVVRARTFSPTPQDVADDPRLRMGSYVLITVSDTGHGMDEETRQRAFEPFFTTKTRGQGTGLGLATSNRIVMDHGGAMAVTSEPGKGTEFKVYLPRCTASAGRPTIGRDSGAVPLARGASVLLVEDEEIVRVCVQRVLETAGVTVFAANDGIEAIDRFREHERDIDLVLLDLDLPRMSGDEVLEALRSLDPHVRVLISSGYLDTDRRAALEETGVAGFVPKPVEPRTLLRRIADTVSASP